MRGTFLILASCALLVSCADPQTSTGAPTTTSTPSTSTSTSSTPAPTPPTSTTPAPTTSSTPAPTTSTTPTPTTSKPPAPSEPTLGNYSLLNESDKKYCLYLVTKATVLLNGTVLDGVANATINNVESSCTADKVRLWLDWSEKNFIQIVLKHDNVTYSIDEISLKVNDLTSDKKGLGQFATNLKSHYKCSQKSTVDLEQGFTVLFTDLKMQAFQEDPKLEFTGKQLECQSDSHNDTVIIAVGCALAILVVIILVAYLIVRRRNRQRGYQSV